MQRDALVCQRQLSYLQGGPATMIQSQNVCGQRFFHKMHVAVWGYQNSETPEPIVTKFGMGDMTKEAKIQTDRPSGGVAANG